MSSGPTLYMLGTIENGHSAGLPLPQGPTQCLMMFESNDKFPPEVLALQELFINGVELVFMPMTGGEFLDMLPTFAERGIGIIHCWLANGKSISIPMSRESALFLDLEDGLKGRDCWARHFLNERNWTLTKHVIMGAFTQKGISIRNVRDGLL